jgi:hypothetical protein
VETIKTNNEKKTTAMRAKLEIEDQLIEVIIDTGAAISVITNKLRKKLGIPIYGTSKFRCTIANGEKIAALGKTKITIRYKDELEIEKEIEVIESQEEDLILGNDIWKKFNTKINFEDKILEVMEQGETITIPIKYERDNENEYDSDNYNNGDYDEEYDSNDETEVFSMYQNFK